MAEEPPRVIVYPPDEEGSRRLRVDGEILGTAYGLGDVIEFLRRAGWPHGEQWPPIQWRGGGPEHWSPGPPAPL
ncbi:hypothetical protein [Streptomyces sp. NPDC096030]|uniref:hypothetical protein n=1 Tax=Streptomyces sp. NPDC096030 TaxID=3155423 RepID=UPI00332B6B89